MGLWTGLVPRLYPHTGLSTRVKPGNEAIMDDHDSKCYHWDFTCIQIFPVLRMELRVGPPIPTNSVCKRPVLLQYGRSYAKPDAALKIRTQVKSTVKS